MHAMVLLPNWHWECSQTDSWNMKSCCSCSFQQKAYSGHKKMNGLSMWRYLPLSTCRSVRLEAAAPADTMLSSSRIAGPVPLQAKLAGTLPTLSNTGYISQIAFPVLYQRDCLVTYLGILLWVNAIQFWPLSGEIMRLIACVHPPKFLLYRSHAWNVCA